jgi:hypothetical protein
VKGNSLTQLFNEQLQSISQLIGSKKIDTIGVVNDNAEEGYAASTVNPEINVLLLVKVQSSLIALTAGSRGFEFTFREDGRKGV